MHRPDLALLAAYLVAGAVLIGCALSPVRSGWLRSLCALVGAAFLAWPAWVYLSGRWYLAGSWPVVPLALPALLVGLNIAGALRLRRPPEPPDAPACEPEDEPTDPDTYPADVPPGQAPPPHDPWRALYSSQARQQKRAG